MMIARRALVAGLLLGGALPLPALAGEEDESPLLVLRAANPWSAVVGAESARFVLYGDGTAIYERSDGALRMVKLDPGERAALIEQIGFAVLPRYAGRYETNAATDQVEQWLYLFGAGKPRVIYVYGPLDHYSTRSAVPPPVVAAYDRLVHFDHPRARPWMPERIELLLWPFDHARQDPLPWPPGWPGLDDPGTRKRGEGAYSLYLPAGRLGELEALMAGQGESQPVGLAGRKWSLAYRLPLPGEQRWMRPARD